MGLFGWIFGGSKDPGTLVNNLKKSNYSLYRETSRTFNRVMSIRQLRNKLPFGWTGNIKSKLKTADPSQITKYSAFKKQLITPTRKDIEHLISRKDFKEMDPTLQDFFVKEKLTLNNFERQI